MRNRLMMLVLLLVVANGVMMAQYKKAVSILGDSYSTFEGYLQPDTNAVWYWKKPQKTDVSSVTQTWWHLFVTEKGYRLCQNNSFSGSTICNTGYGKADYSRRSFIARMDNLGSPDIILILGATNDSWAGAPIGGFKYADWTTDELYHFRPAMAYMLDYMKNRYPNVDIYFILNSELSSAINESVETICKHYGIDCIVLENIDKMNGHPSIKGMKQIAEQVGRGVRN